MADKKLTLATIPAIDGGKIEAQINKTIAQAYDDMVQRPGDKSKRVVSIDVEFTPVPDQDGSLESVGVEFKMDIKIPARRSRVYSMAPHHGAKGLVFNDAAPENPRQRTLDQAAGDESED